MCNIGMSGSQYFDRTSTIGQVLIPQHKLRGQHRGRNMKKKKKKMGVTNANPGGKRQLRPHSGLLGPDKRENTSITEKNNISESRDDDGDRNVEDEIKIDDLTSNGSSVTKSTVQTSVIGTKSPFNLFSKAAKNKIDSTSVMSKETEPTTPAGRVEDKEKPNNTEQQIRAIGTISLPEPKNVPAKTSKPSARSINENSRYVTVDKKEVSIVRKDALLDVIPFNKYQTGMGNHKGDRT
ncbi:hypothetical protein ColLi_12162 [Colletotrichum liriopes]|uniref:Uncharacterized protein n=1 Tax=Colletotrichum liriopes TaxID=708192 RepID=A0AA37GXV2_9PEZI|nr:hypothetical protein ColLi_12162 [Colletotrichum liriopes]